jgi:hypothetical protein
MRDIVAERRPSACIKSGALEVSRGAEACERARATGRPMALSEIEGAA